jgi:hypothetical protein
MGRNGLYKTGCFAAGFLRPQFNLSCQQNT